MNGDRILVVRMGAMGDIIHTLPAVASLKQSFPHCTICWAVEERWLPLLEGNPFVDELVVVNRQSLRAIIKLRAQLRSRQVTFAVDFQGLIKSAIVASLARPERIYGLHRSCAREPIASIFYSSTVKLQSTHVVEQHLELAAGTGANNLVRSFTLPQGKPEGELPSDNFVLANPLAGWTSKQWPLENYMLLAIKLRSETGYRLVLNGSKPTGLPDCWSHVSGLPGLIDATRRAAAVVGVDSGPMHLAAALGKPGVAIFGPTDPARNGPYGSSFSVLRQPGAPTTYKREKNVADSMRSITVDQVLLALKARLLCPAVP